MVAFVEIKQLEPYPTIFLLVSCLQALCVESGVLYLDSSVESIVEASNGISHVACGHNIVVSCRLATVASAAASGKLLQYKVGGPKVAVQTAYGIEVEVENNPYDPSLMVFMDYRNYTKQKAPSLEAEYPTFLHVMPMSPTTLFFEVCSMYISLSVLLLNLLSKYLEKLIAGNWKKLLSWLMTMGICIMKTYEEDWSWIPVGGSLPNTEQNNLAFGAAACMVHPATAIVGGVSHANQIINRLASTVCCDLHITLSAHSLTCKEYTGRKKGNALFGLALILQQDTEGIMTFFCTFFCLSTWMWQGFLGSTLSSADLLHFALSLRSENGLTAYNRSMI
ncbi:lycopene epsilon cyclase [Pyrus ussuriensis x Pyrus communis]|uniref:Lycopene epsilon cyclase n=1 Tax=Pyrus ussuriensis x Pyrus communis TaxID=2448454 RepID=A0A5N5H1B2_9ROSA|nr:lycopene epsilon cyclase [Pyrus ussuriensis x Pyrus communis]